MDHKQQSTAALAAAGFVLTPPPEEQREYMRDYWRKDIGENHYIEINFDEVSLYGDPTVKQWAWAAYFHNRPESGSDEGLTLAQAIALADLYAKG